MRFLCFLCYTLILSITIHITLCDENEYVEEALENPSTQETEGQEPVSAGVHYAYSPIHLTFLAKIEQQLYASLGNYEQDLIKRLEIVQRYRWDYENSVLPSLETWSGTGDEWERASYLTSHPLIVYRMISRYTRNLREFYEDIGRNTETELMNLMESWRGTYFWPSPDDLTQIGKSIFRLQETYDISSTQFAEGDLNGLMTNARANAKHCVEIAEIALSLGDSLTAGEWLKAARQKLVYENDNSIHMDDFMQYWDKAIRLHGKTWNIDDVNIVDIFQASKSILKQEYEVQKFNLTFENRIQNFKALCRDEIPPQIQNQRSGHCFLITDVDPYFLINPQHLEFHNMDLGIMEIHNFFGQKLIQDVSNAAFDPVMKANEHGSEKESLFLSSKTTASAWITEPFPSMSNAFKKLGKILQYEIDYEDEPFFYMQSYSVGSYYEPCLICEEEFPGLLEKSGKRIGTIEFIMDETEAGGETVFTNLGLKIKPNKGSVLVIRQNKEEKSKMNELRGSCPVLLGQKWVASKFIYEGAQSMKTSVIANN